MTNRNRLIDDMGTLALSLENRAAGYRLAGDKALAHECSAAARALWQAHTHCSAVALMESDQ